MITDRLSDVITAKEGLGLTHSARLPPVLRVTSRIAVRRAGRAILAVQPVEGRRTREPYPDSDKTAAEVVVSAAVAWVVLVVSGVLEAVWATALGRSDGFTRPAPTAIFGVALVLSVVGLAYSLRALPVGTAYAVWFGIGAVLTVAYAMATGEESVSLLKVLLLAGIVGCVVGLKLLH